MPQSCGGFGEVSNQQAVWGLNTFRENIKIDFSVTVTSNLTFTLWNVNGQTVAKKQAIFQTGDAQLIFEIEKNRNRIKPGIYVVKISGENFEFTKKMVYSR